MVRSRRTAGTSLIEILVVIVVFLVGILAIAQIFPGGFKILGWTRNQSMGVQLARSEIERLKGRSDQLPDMILPVKRIFGGGGVIIIADQTRSPNDLGPYGDAMDPNGNLIDTATGTTLGEWRYNSAANIFSRVVGEGRVVPAPRTIGADYGGLMVLQFAPVIVTSTYAADFPVYGNDLSIVDDAPSGGSTRPWQFFVENSDTTGATIYVAADPTHAVQYRVAMSAYITNGGNASQRDVVGAIIDVPAGVGYASFPLSNYAGLLPGDVFQGAEFESIRCAKVFQQVASFSASDPYEYKLLSGNLGILLFNPLGYNYLVRTAGGRRVPLTARADYDVYDWGVIREQFRIPSTQPSQQRLAINNIKVKGNLGADGVNYTGMPFNVPVNGGSSNIDVILLDEDTGGVYQFDEASPLDPTKSSYSVDKSIGLIRFQDADPGTPGLQMKLFYPGAGTATTILAEGRSVRVLYRAENEWQVQALKAASQYYQASAPGGVGTYYVTGVQAGGFQNNRIYFPWTDLGRKVNIGELYYIDGSGNKVGPIDFSSVVKTSSADPMGYPFIDITEMDASARNLDSSNGYEVRYVKGASIAVRVLWNPVKFKVDSDNATNFNHFRTFQEGWRHNTTETYLQRGEN